MLKEKTNNGRKNVKKIWKENVEAKKNENKNMKEN
jgi:hypothetical protein